MSTIMLGPGSAAAAPVMTPASPTPDAGARERVRAEAEQWLAALPIRTGLRRRGFRGHGAAFPRLVMYRTGASTPEFWEKTWLVSPPFRMRGYKLPAWYREVFTCRLPREGVIVEAGCGNGNLIRMLANEDPRAWGDFSREPGHGACVEGLDFAENAVKENRRVHPEGVYTAGDVRSLPYGDGELSGYLSMGVVEHFDEGERAVILSEAARCLRPGGVAVITVPSFSPARRLRALLGGFEDEAVIERERGDAASSADQAAGSARLDFYQYFFTPREIRGQIEAAGLKVIETDGYDCRRGWTDAFGGGTTLSWLEKRSKWLARRIEQPPKLFRRFCPHMVMLVAVKP
jgi:SAM-dependent methyltransferase